MFTRIALIISVAFLLSPSAAACRRLLAAAALMINYACATTMKLRHASGLPILKTVAATAAAAAAEQ